jgi:hypothetical protein
MLNRSCSGRERGCAATPTGCVTSQPTGCGSPLARLLPRGRWTEFLPIRPATLLAWHRKLAAFFAPPDPVAERKLEARHDRTFDGRPMRFGPATLDELHRWKPDSGPGRRGRQYQSTDQACSAWRRYQRLQTAKGATSGPASTRTGWPSALRPRWDRSRSQGSGGHRRARRRGSAVLPGSAAGLAP